MVLQFAIHFLAAVVAARALWNMAVTLAATWRERKAILEIARELDEDARLLERCKGCGLMVPVARPCGACAS